MSHRDHFSGRRTALAGLLCGVFALAGCSEKPPAFHSLDITGIAGYGSELRLTDHNGTARSLADFRGKAVALFFGYTHCPDVCPTTLAEFRGAMQRLGSAADQVQVLFVTVDPQRDTPALLAQYVPAFHPSFLGLYGDAAATQRVARDFKIVARTVPGKTPDSYTVDHTAGTFIFDRQGRLRLMAPYGIGDEKLAEDLKQILRSNT